MIYSLYEGQSELQIPDILLLIYLYGWITSYGRDGGVVGARSVVSATTCLAS